MNKLEIIIIVNSTLFIATVLMIMLTAIAYNPPQTILQAGGLVLSGGTILYAVIAIHKETRGL